MNNTFGRSFVALSIAGFALAFGVGCSDAPQPEPGDDISTTTAALKAEKVNKLLCGVWEGDGPRHNYTLLPNGVRTYPFGENSVARVQFRRDGYATHFVSKNASERAACANPAGHLACSPAEADAAFDSAVAVNYRFVAAPTSDNAGSLTWNVDFSTYPNWTGQSLQRSYELADRDHLKIIVPVGPGVTANILLARVADCNDKDAD